MKILIIQENGRHIENREFRECFNLHRALIRKLKIIFFRILNMDSGLDALK